MCLSIPGKIIRIINNEAIIDYDIEQRKGLILDPGYKEGDYVILQGGVVL